MITVNIISINPSGGPMNCRRWPVNLHLNGTAPGPAGHDAPPPPKAHCPSGRRVDDVVIGQCAEVLAAAVLLVPALALCISCSFARNLTASLKPTKEMTINAPGAISPAHI
jgi:hypothetical protein